MHFTPPEDEIPRSLRSLAAKTGCDGIKGMARSVPRPLIVGPPFGIRIQDRTTPDKSGTLDAHTGLTVGCQTGDVSTAPNPLGWANVDAITFEAPEYMMRMHHFYDVRGRLVSRLLQNEHKESGSHTIQFKAPGRATGIYFVRLESGGAVQTHKIVVLK